MTNRKKYFHMFLLGFSSIIASAPIYIFVVMFGIFTILYMRISHAHDWKFAFKKGLAFGFGYYLANTYWIALSLFEDMRFIVLLPLALTIIPLYFASFLAACMALHRFLYSKIHNHVLQIATFALLWILHEKLRAHLIFPFPWWPIGMTLSDIDAWVQPLGIISIYFFGFFVVLLYLLPVFVMQKIQTWQRFCAIFFILAIHGIFITYGYLQLNRREITELPFNISMVQTNLTQFEKWKDARAGMEKHYNFTNLALKSNTNNKPNLVIWAETSVPYFIDKSSVKAHISSVNSSMEEFLSSDAIYNSDEYFALISSLLGEGDKVIFGAVGVDGEDHTNSAFLLEKTQISQRYNKINLVPFGEYVPLLPIKIGFLPGFSPGKERQIWEIAGMRVIPLICYEVLFDKNLKKLHPNLIVNISNDGWFGNSIGPHQHLAHAKISAIRNGVPLIRVANTGISAIFDKRGRILQKIDRKVEGFRNY